MRYVTALFMALWAISGSVVFAATLPSRHVAKTNSYFDVNATHRFGDPDISFAKRQGPARVPLRILSLGASIMFGSRSSDGNGLRKPLRDALRYDDWDVNMVGSRKSGNMVDYNHEATEGFVITDMINVYPRSAGYKANLVIINCGTNDASQGIDPGNAGERMRTLLNNIWSSPDMGNTCVILSTLLPNANANVDLYRGVINDKYRSLVTELAGVGECIYLADMDPPTGSGKSWISTATDITDDGTHPNDGGYKKVAYIFYQAINKAYADGNLSYPASFLGTSTGCDKVFGNGISAGGHTQKGSGADDGLYYHDAQDKGIIISIVSAWDRNQWRFARLWSINYDDLVAWIDTTPAGSTTKTNEYAFWKNSADGKGQYTKILPNFPVAMYCDPAGLHFIDMNGAKSRPADGIDDIVCIAPNGDISLSINNNNGIGTKPPTFTSMGVVKTNEGYARDRVVLADIDGDGRGDYGVVDDAGNTWFYRNAGTGNAPAFWQPLGSRASYFGVPDTDKRGIRYEDINGDGRDDWMWVSSTGAVTTWTNARSCLAGKDGDGLNVAWRQGFHKGENSGPTHAGVSIFVTPTETYLRDRIHFGRVYGGPHEFSILPRQDYIFMQHTALANGMHQFDVRVFANAGFGGTRMKADGDKYCNMVGHTDGREDYVWTMSTGEMQLFANLGKTYVTEEESFWNPTGVIWTPPYQMDRRDLHLVDYDGDGDCDIVYVDPDRENAMVVYINNYPTTQDWSTAWSFLSTPIEDRSVYCGEKRGLGIHDLAVRFADISGNGRGDYLCIKPDGRTSGFLHNTEGSWTTVPQIKAPDGKDRANLRWADVNGDGQDDLLWVEKYGGDGYVYYNRGPGAPADNLGSSFHWEKIDNPVYDGGFEGSCIYFPDLDGNGRADLHQITGTFTNSAYTSFNPSCGLDDRQGDDPGGATNPNLPVPPVDPPRCNGGTGPGDIAKICSFACQYGFCPPPCTCTSTGAPNNPPPSDSYITASATSGRDSATVDPICSFACTRGYCPENICNEALALHPPQDLPQIPSVGPFDSSKSYSAGDYFTYVSPDDDQLTMTIQLIGAARQWEDIDCGGADALDCIAQAVAYLYYGMALGGAAELGPDIAARHLASTGSNFQVHSEWTPEGNCTARCKLLASAPQNTWVPMGNGTHRGIPHEIHFMHNENMTGHSVRRHSVRQLSPRYVSGYGNYPGNNGYPHHMAATYYGPHKADLIDTGNFLDVLDDDLTPHLPPDFYGHSVADSIRQSNFSKSCQSVGGIGQVSKPALMTISYEAELVNQDEILHDLTQCAEEEDIRPPWVIYPKDRRDTDDADRLIKGYGGQPSTSIVDGLRLYWSARLTLAERLIVLGHYQVLTVPLECFSNCYDEFEFSTTDQTLKKRDMGVIETLANPDLAFVSQARGASFNPNYIHDATAGLNVFVYVMDNDFRLNHIDFNARSPQDGFTLLERVLFSSPTNGMRVTSVPGLPERLAGHLNQHGTFVLDALAGNLMGVVPNVRPVLYLENNMADTKYLLDTLDAILNDWKFRAGHGTSTPLAVLNMSFGTGTFDDGFLKAMYDRLILLINAGVLPVAAAGNQNLKDAVFYPASFANPTLVDLHIPEMISVGGVNNDGSRWDTGLKGSNWNDYSIYAPAEMTVAWVAQPDAITGNSPPGSVWVTAHGTSIAAPKVAGLAAYFIGLSSFWVDRPSRGTVGIAPGFGIGNVPNGNVLALKNLLSQLAYPRDAGGEFPAIWNSIRPASGPGSLSLDMKDFSLAAKNLSLVATNISAVPVI